MFVAFACASSAAASAEEVFTADGENFDQFIKDNSFVAVEFYAPWCGHCKALAPEWEKAAQKLKGDTEKPIKLAKVDCTEEKNKALASKFGVKGFPTIKVFRDHDAEKPTDYEGPRESPGIESYLRKQAGPATSLLKDAAAVKALRTFSDDRDAVVIGVFPGGESGDAFTAFQETASALRSDIEFGHITDASLLPEAKDTKEAAVLLLKPEDGGEVPATTYGGALSKKELSAWVEKVSAPALVTLDQSAKNKKALQKVFADPKPKLLGFIAKDDKAYKDFKGALVKASSEADNVNVIFAETGGNNGALEYFGIKEKDTPALVIHDQKGGDLKFVSKNVDAAAVATFLSDFKAGKLERTIKSEEPPADNSGPVTILTAKTFNDIVYGKPRNVLIEFYAPWCGHCKKLTPIYEKVGEAFKDDDTVVVAKLDATANDIPDTTKFQVSGFPTLKFVTADGKVVDYSGDRSEEDLVKFIKANADSKAPASDEL